MKLTQNGTRCSPKSEMVGHSKATFRNRIRHHAGGRRAEEREGKLPAIAANKRPFGAVKEQSSGLYAQKMAELGFLQLPLTRPIPARAVVAPLCSISGHQHEDFCAAVDFLSVQENVDPERIGIIGICGWGGMAERGGPSTPVSKPPRL